MVESVRIPKNCPGEYRKMVESVLVPEKSQTNVSTKNGWIRANTEKLSGRLPENGKISVSTEKWWKPGKYREKVESERESKICPEEYRKMVESVWVPKNGRIQESIGKT